MFSTITAPEIPFCHSYLQVKTYQLFEHPKFLRMHQLFRYSDISETWLRD